MFILSKANYKFNEMSFKTSKIFFCRNRKTQPKIHMGSQWELNNQNNLEKKNITERLMLPWFQNLLQGYSNQNSGTGIKQMYRATEYYRKPQINPYIYGQMIFDRGVKTIQWKKDSLFNKWCWENWISTCKWMNLDSYLMHIQELTQNGSRT